MDSLADVLNEKPTEKEEQAPEPKAEAPAEARAEPDKGLAADGQPRTENRRREHQKREWEAQGRDPETGQFVAKPKQDEAPKEPAKETKQEAKHEEKPAPKPAETKAPAQELTEKERAAFAAAADERRKRQELERRLEALERSQQKPAEPKKAFWDDPEGALKANEQSLREVQVQTRLQTSEIIARSKYQDFDEKIAVFAEMVEKNPALGAQFVQQAHPAEYAYQAAKNHQEMQQAGGLEGLRKKIEEETAARVRAEVEAEYRKREEEAARQRAAIPPSLSDVRGGTGTRAAPVWGGPPSLEEVLKP